MTATVIAAERPTAAPAPVTPARRRRPWMAITVIVLGALFVAAAPVWRAWAVPALVRFPTNVDLRPRYEGNFTVYVDPATAAPLAAPSTKPLVVNREIQTIPGQSTTGRVVVRETIAYDVPGLAPASQVHQYVMDRRSFANVADQRAWAFDSSNPLNRAGAYWVSLPMSSPAAASVSMFKDETATTFAAIPAGAEEKVDGMRLVAYDARATAVPLSEAYLRSLDKVVPLPRALLFDQLKPALVAAGVPVDAALAALVKVATPADLNALVQLTKQPIPLQYVDTFSGRTFVEPRTGAIVDASSVVERVSARPSAGALPPLLAILGRYQSQPAAAEAITALQGLATKPIPVFEYRYAQTDQSVSDVASWVHTQRNDIKMAEQTVPFVLVGVGTLLIVGGGVALIVRRRRFAHHASNEVVES